MQTDTRRTDARDKLADQRHTGPPNRILLDSGASVRRTAAPNMK
jgi:hypothetical protein